MISVEIPIRRNVSFPIGISIGKLFPVGIFTGKHNSYRNSIGPSEETLVHIEISIGKLSPIGIPIGKQNSYRNSYVGSYIALFRKGEASI